jgi:hypothetical protein
MTEATTSSPSGAMPAAGAPPVADAVPAPLPPPPAYVMPPLPYAAPPSVMPPNAYAPTFAGAPAAFASAAAGAPYEVLPPFAPPRPSVVAGAPFPVSRGVATVLAAVGPAAIGGLLAAQAGTASPLLAAPAIVFGVVTATAPALYIASAAAGHAPPLAIVVRAFGFALGAFGLALAGLVLPAAFVALSSTSATASFAAASAAIAGAAFFGLRRLAGELGSHQLRADEPVTALATRKLVFGVWAVATLSIAGRLWWDLAAEVLS